MFFFAKFAKKKLVGIGEILIIPAMFRFCKRLARFIDHYQQEVVHNVNKVALNSTSIGILCMVLRGTSQHLKTQLDKNG